jgi:DNA-binding transcriptional MocR family regulator
VVTSYVETAHQSRGGDLERPLYLRLAEGLSTVVAHEGLAGLPSARALAQEAGLNRATVTAAYRELARRGLLVLRRGRASRQGPARPAAAESFAEQPENSLDLARYVPDQALLPAQNLLRWLGLGEAEGETVAQYGDPWGFGGLREWLRARLGGWGLRGRLLLTSGVQHGLDLLLRALVRPGDVVLVEDPSYPGLPPLLAMHQARMVGLPVHADGIHSEDLEALLARVKPLLAVLTPTLHNPSGTVASLASRQAALARLQKSRVTVVEELFDPGLLTVGVAPPPLAALDTGVIAVGSFSKVLFPGLRVGWLSGPEELVDRIAAVKRATDLSGSPFLEATAWSLCRQGLLDAQVARLRAAAAERAAVVLGELAAAPNGVRWSQPQGGFSLMVLLPEGWSARAVAARAARRGVWVLPGPAMSASGRDDVVRLAFAAAGGERLRHGVGAFVAALRAPVRELPLV